MPEISQHYKKIALTIDQQLELLIKQELIVKNPKRVLHYLRFIGYHRLSGYFRTFQIQNTSEHIFKKGTTFDFIISLYIFDRKLRLLVMDAVERIEVAVRSTISSTMCEKYGPHWYLKPMLFKSSFNHKNLIKTIEYETGFNADVSPAFNVQEVDEVDVVFIADAGLYQDAVKPYNGPLPVLRYITPYSYATSGVLDQAGQKLEIVTLPKSYDPTDGALDIELSPSLAAAILKALGALEEDQHYSVIAQMFHFLPNAITSRAKPPYQPANS